MSIKDKYIVKQILNKDAEEWFFCKHDYLWVRNVYGDEIYMTGKFKRSWCKCNKCGKWQSKEQLHTDGRS